MVAPQMRHVVMGERKRCLDTCRSFCWCTGVSGKNVLSQCKMQTAVSWPDNTHYIV